MLLKTNNRFKISTYLLKTLAIMPQNPLNKKKWNLVKTTRVTRVTNQKELQENALFR
tara:strand:+ start:490 stop:660 length:171 start_codon:yes stop_codon:yes gene_type:complete